MRILKIIIVVIFTVIFLPLKLLLPRDLYECLEDGFINTLIGQLVVLCLLHLFFDDFLENMYPFHVGTQDNMEFSIVKNKEIRSPLNAEGFSKRRTPRKIRLIFQEPSDYNSRFKR